MAWVRTLPGRSRRQGYPRRSCGTSRTPARGPMVLWLDLAAHLRQDLDPLVRDAVHALARFQRWLHGTEDPAALRQLIQEREAYAQ